MLLLYVSFFDDLNHHFHAFASVILCVCVVIERTNVTFSLRNKSYNKYMSVCHATQLRYQHFTSLDTPTPISAEMSPARCRQGAAPLFLFQTCPAATQFYNECGLDVFANAIAAIS